MTVVTVIVTVLWLRCFFRLSLSLSLSLLSLSVCMSVTSPLIVQHTAVSLRYELLLFVTCRYSSFHSLHCNLEWSVFWFITQFILIKTHFSFSSLIAVRNNNQKTWFFYSFFIFTYSLHPLLITWTSTANGSHRPSRLFSATSSSQYLTLTEEGVSSV